ncbi:sulfite exporter TauE/SafE family protein [Kiloniella sp. EL199]|uniref:sulfite exporter TauE/SafE family protein n=1 Tax=Kiloniella sp. EL199 TaxID=2107581 RepID=UPI0013C4F818|nr:sulfite exporter TauE/SafE family protein [Kiloniella sp. EL199]
MEPYIFLAIAFLGSLISALFGLGSGLIVLSLGSLFIPIKDCIALATILFMASTFTKTILYHQYIDWKLSAIIALGSIPFSLLGAETLASIDPEPLRPLLAGFIILSVIISTLGLQLFLPQRASIALAVAALYGYVSGLLSSGNPIKALALDRMGFEKQSFIGVMAATALGVNITKLVSYSDNSILRPEHYPLGIALIVISITSALIGKKLIHRIENDRYKQGLSVILIFSAIALLFK